MTRTSSSTVAATRRDDRVDGFLRRLGVRRVGLLAPALVRAHHGGRVRGACGGLEEVMPGRRGRAAEARAGRPARRGRVARTAWPARRARRPTCVSASDARPDVSMPPGALLESSVGSGSLASDGSVLARVLRGPSGPACGACCRSRARRPRAAGAGLACRCSGCPRLATAALARGRAPDPGGRPHRQGGPHRAAREPATACHRAGLHRRTCPTPVPASAFRTACNGGVRSHATGAALACGRVRPRQRACQAGRIRSGCRRGSRPLGGRSRPQVSLGLPPAAGASDPGSVALPVRPSLAATPVAAAADAHAPAVRGLAAPVSRSAAAPSSAAGEPAPAGGSLTAAGAARPASSLVSFGAVIGCRCSGPRGPPPPSGRDTSARDPR